MNNLHGTRIEYHILQSFPVTCLNRDDVGAPKSAIVGGVERARVSSQCWKRQVRLALQDLGIKLGVRTKDIGRLLEEAILKAGANEEQAQGLAEAITPLLSDNTLLFFSHSEANAIAEEAKKNDFEVSKLLAVKESSKNSAKKSKPEEGEKAEKPKKLAMSADLKKAIKKAFNPALDGLDIALFGRMVAQDPDMNMQAASSFAHAISTHKSSNEVEFFTALDDMSTEPGSAHMGALEYNSATYYRYISLDLGQLFDNLHGHDLGKAVEAFTKALYIAVPSARQTTQAGMLPWAYARVQIRKGQGMQVSFERPVTAKEGYLEPSIMRLDEVLARQEKLSGSLYGKIENQDYVFGADEKNSMSARNVNIDELAAGLAEYVKEFEAAE